MTKKRFFAILSTAAQSAFLIFRQNVEFNGVFQSAKPFVKKSFFFSAEKLFEVKDALRLIIDLLLYILYLAQK